MVDRSLTLDMTMNQARRIETEFRHSAPAIAKLFKDAFEEQLRRDAQYQPRAPDEALIPVSVAVSLQEAVAIRDRYSRLIDAATDREIYLLVQRVLDKIRKS